MKYLKFYKNTKEYLSDGISEEEYNDNPVIYILSDLKTGDDVLYEDYQKIPLTFEMITDGDIKWLASSTYYKATISYSLNEGQWTQITSNTGASAPIIHASAGDIIRFKGNTLTYSTTDARYNSFYGSTGKFNVYGNIMSLIDSDNFNTLTTLSSGRTFDRLFRSTNVIDAGNLVLPATTLASSCYTAMFIDCTGLTSAPVILPATSLMTSYACYSRMFQNCTSLINAPELPAKNLEQHCYYQMFYGCTSLKTAPEIESSSLPYYSCSYMFYGCTNLTTPPTSIGSAGYSVNNYACYRMFYNCSSLKTAPNLPSISLMYNAYEGMFQNCTSLTKAPALPASAFGGSVYANMFAGCTNLTTAPDLPATRLAYYCYSNMFYNCTSLKTGPILPATTLADSCYFNMFGGCTSLITAPALPATTLASNCYNSMFSNCRNLKIAPALPARNLAVQCYSNMFNGCTSLEMAPELLATTLVNSCYYDMFAGCSKLNSIVCLVDDIQDISWFGNWVYHVSESGVFVKSASCDWPIGPNGIPSGWTIKEMGVAPYMAMWIDDYPSEEDFNAEFYGYSSFDDYLDDYMEDPETYGSNLFYYTDETVEYGGVTYYAWYSDDLDIYYLTNTINYSTLYNLSMQANHSNRNCPVYAMLWSDLDGDPYIKNYDDIYHVLVKVEDHRNNGGALEMWIDDFPTIFERFYNVGLDGIETYTDYFNYLFSTNPGRTYAGANKYSYYGDTLDFDGNTYYVWRFSGNENVVKYALTSTVDFETLSGLSIEANYSNRNCPIYTFLESDMTQSPYVPEYDSEDFVLLKVVQYRTPPSLLMTMWIDDYPDDYGIPEEYGFDNWVDYFSYLLEENPNDTYMGANKYCYYGDTMEYDGNTYYLWVGKTEYTTGCVKYALTSTVEYNDLYLLSIEDDYSNRNCPIYALLNEDSTMYHVLDFDSEDYVLLKVENNQS